MNKLNIKNILFILTGMTVLLLFLLLKIQGIANPQIIDLLSKIPMIVSIEMLIMIIFCSFLWKLQIFQGWLVPFPDLNGTWKGDIRTTWIDPITNKTPDPIPAILTIKQSFFNTSCILRTGEMTSYSVSSNFEIENENQKKLLNYKYNSNPKPRVKERSPSHLGTVQFEIIEKPIKKLRGEYWTERKTTGEIIMNYWKKERLDYYPEGIGSHPVSKIRKEEQ